MPRPQDLPHPIDDFSDKKLAEFLIFSAIDPTIGLTWLDDNDIIIAKAYQAHFYSWFWDNSELAFTLLTEAINELA